MPRGSGGRSGGSGRSSSYRPSSRPAARSPPPKTANHAPPPAPAPASSGGSILGNLGASLADGFGFGAASAAAHRAVDAVMGPRTFRVEHVDAPAAQPAAVATSAADACGNQSKAFQDCLNQFESNIGKCQFYLDMLSECKRKSGVMGA